MHALFKNAHLVGVVLLVLVLLGAVAYAGCPDSPKTKIQIVCDVDLMGMSKAARTLSAKTTVTPLTMKSTGEKALLTFGPYSLVAQMTCSGKSDSDMAWNLELRLSHKDLPYAAPVHYASISGLELAKRKAPFKLTSYHFPEKPFEHKQDGKPIKITRIDYTCQVVRR